MDKSEVQLLGFEIVAYAGDARTTIFEAFELLSQGKYDEARELKEKANEMLNKAHSKQVELLQQEVSETPTPYSFIMMHGQDHLMSAMLLRDLFETVATIFKRV